MAALTLLAAAGLVAAAGGASAASDSASLGIPSTVPWQDGIQNQAAKGKESEKAAVEEGFWERMHDDSAALDRSRGGLKAALAFARSHPEVFPPRPAARAGGLFDEYAELAVRTWFFFADHYLALEGLMGRYGDFSALPDARSQSAAFSCACAARLAQRRSLAEWVALAARDPVVDKALEGAEESGFPRALYANLKRLSASGAADAAALEACAKPGARPPGAGKGARSRKALRVELPLLSRPGRWRGAAPAEPEPPAEDAQAFIARESGSDWMDLPVSSQIVSAVQAVKSYLSPDPPQGPRPDSMVTLKQLEEMRPSLEPGDILLIRRELFIGEIGLGGYWRDSALYAGTPSSRRKFFGSQALDESLKSLDAEAFARNSAKGRGMPEFFAPEGGRAALKPLANAAAGDCVAVLRPRVSKQAKAEALRGLFALLGKPLDTAGGLLRAAYGQSLRWPLRPALGRAALPVNALAQAFDAEFGTQREQFDFVAFFDAQETWRKAANSTLEEFRASWRRPAWAPKPQPEGEKDSEGGRP